MYKKECKNALLLVKVRSILEGKDDMCISWQNAHCYVQERKIACISMSCD